VAVSESDRKHFARIAEAKRCEQEERMREALDEHPVKKMIEGLEMGYAAPTTPEIESMLDERARGQAELHARARRLGMIR